MKKILTIQDLSCIGKCSLTVALPIISRMGIEVAVLPTALLSTHTAFKDNTCLDLSLEMRKIVEHWKTQNFKFDLIYTGYIGNELQMAEVENCLKEFKTKDNLLIVDPAMADDGRLYRGFDLNFVQKMKELCSKADIIVPNFTEATLLLGMEYKKNFNEEEVKEILLKFSKMGVKFPVITGVSFNENELGAMGYDSEKQKFFSSFRKKYNEFFHGTGDVFASVLAGAIANGNDMPEATRMATDFTTECVRVTYEDKEADRYGSEFEKVMKNYKF